MDDERKDYIPEDDDQDDDLLTVRKRMRENSQKIQGEREKEKPVKKGRSSSPGHDIKKGKLILGGMACVIAALLIAVLALAAGKGKKKTGDSGEALAGSSGTSDLQAVSAASDLQAASGTSGAAAAAEDEEITILAAGDNLIHQQINYEYQTEDGGYDYSPVYADVKDEISQADIAYVNSETPMAGDILPVSGYPVFNTPPQNADALVDAGFDIVNQGNNHACDMGADGMEHTLGVWQERNIPVTGMYKDDADLHTMRIIEKKGVRIAFLGFLEMMNQSIPDGYQFVFIQDEDKVKALIEEAKQQADLVVVSVHWGTEYTTELSARQLDMGQKMADWGADIIFGSHPHVIQKLDVLTRAGDGRKVPIIYSLGNFISAMPWKQELPGGFLTVKVVKDGRTGEVYPDSMQFTPLVSWYGDNYSNIHVVRFDDLDEETAEQHGIRNLDSILTRDYIQSVADECIPSQFQGKFGSI